MAVKYINAYPNTEGLNSIPGQRDTDKWLNTIQTVYQMNSNGIDKDIALKQITANWHPVELQDFLNWVKFYEQRSHLKYKMANIWFDQKPSGYFLQVKKPEFEDTNNAEQEPNIDNRKAIIEKQRSKIIGRLDSAEKLLRSRDGQMFAGKELESLMEAIYQLKKKVQLVNKITLATKTYEDLIIREANILNKNGFSKASNVLYKLAQEIPQTPEAQLPTVGNGGAPGGMPSMGPGMPQVPLENSPNNKPQSKVIAKFLEKMNSGNLTDNKELDIEDKNNIEDEELFVSEAQVQPEQDIPITTNTSPIKRKPAEFVPDSKSDPDTSAESIETINKKNPVNPKDEVSEQTSKLTSDFDNKLDELMKNVTVSDIIVELESLSKIFKTREIPRRLSRADMMLDSLGLAPFFPSLSEAQNKSLEANNYIATRVDDILSKLRGSIAAPEIDLQGDDQVKPEVKNLKNKLENDQNKEKARKQMRKEQENEEIESKNKPTPEVEVEKDLTEPVETAPITPQTNPI